MRGPAFNVSRRGSSRLLRFRPQWVKRGIVSACREKDRIEIFKPPWLARCRDKTGTAAFDPLRAMKK
jgi:hypothetical protein